MRCSRGKKWIKKGLKLDKKDSKTVTWSFSDTFWTFFDNYCWGTLSAFISDQFILNMPWLSLSHQEYSSHRGSILTLASLKSERARQVGGGLRKPPLSILAPEQILAQKSCFPKSWHQYQVILPLFRNFFQKSTKKLAKIENLSKNCQKWVKIPNFVIFERFKLAIPQKKAFFT